MRKYNNEYIYPPRPEYKISPNSLITYDDGNYMSQAKFNGSCCEIYIQNDKFISKTRHNSILGNFKLSTDELSILKRENSMVYVGEYMNKSKRDINNQIWNNKYVIFDILVNNNDYLIDVTYKERYDLLTNMFTLKDYDDYLYQISENIFLVKSFFSDFRKRYDDIIKIDMLEGLVIKKNNAKLERGSKEKNNLSIKCRKTTLNYSF